MKILWVKTDFLHPTNRGGQIRTLETVKRLHQRHELHYLALDDGTQPEGPRRAGEYSSKFYAIPHSVPEKSLTSPVFVAQLIAGALSPLPVAVSRWKSPEMRSEIERLQRTEKFDAIVCDFLFPATNFPDLSSAVLFQHNVESMIWQRHVEHASNLPKKLYFKLQADRMAEFERNVSNRVKRVIAVSEADAVAFRQRYGTQNVTAVPTGVDVDYFRPPAGGAAPHDTKADLVFVGSMDWMPNSDGILWFAKDILPLILEKRPATTVAIVGRKPTPEIEALADSYKGKITVTGTVPDVRPWLWGSQVSIVPLRIGGGTRLKIYEAMAAGVPVVSTQIGAEGLDVTDGETIALADDPSAFANRCLELLDDAAARRRMAQQASTLVNEHCSWDSVTTRFERLLA